MTLNNINNKPSDRALVQNQSPLEEFVSMLSGADKALINGIPLNDEITEMDDGQFNELINNHISSIETFSDGEQNRLQELTTELSRVRIRTTIHKEAQKEHKRFQQQYQLQDGGGNGKQRHKQIATNTTSTKEKSKREFLVYKYSNRKKGDLHEAVVLAGKPVFLKYDSTSAEPITLVEIIEEDTRVMKPPYVENYPYDPIEFESINEVTSYLERARKENIDSLYIQSKEIAEDYNDHNKYKIQLLAIDIIWAYFQDKFPTTHYDIVLGSPGSGKSSYGETFAASSYRVVNLTDPNAANINRILGSIEPGQCTIVSDETGAIDKHPDLMSILKTGYSIKGKTSKINDYTREPEFYSTYGFKMVIAEKMPNLKDAKGVHDRSFSFTVFKGRPKYDIKETLEPQGNPARQERLNALNDFRKLMLIYRFLHFKDPIKDISVGIEGREKELSKPVIQLFYGSAAQREVEETLQYFLNQRNEKKDTTLEPVLHPMVTKLVSVSRTNEIYVSQIWESIINGGLRGLYDSKKPNEFQSEDYGIIYRNQIYNILEHTFGGTPKHKENGNTYTFDPSELARVGKSYRLATNIQTKIVLEDDIEGTEGTEGYTEGLLYENDNYRDNSRGNNGLKEVENGGITSIEPSEPSEPSNNHIEETSTSGSYHRLYEGSDWCVCDTCGHRGDVHDLKDHIIRCF